MPFKFKRTLRPDSTRVLMEKPLASSTTFTVGDAVKMNTSNVLALAGAGGALGGVIVEMRKADGSPLTDNGAGGDYVGTYTTPASNTVVAIIDVSKETVYTVTLDAARGTTSGSEDDFCNVDLLAASDQLDESTVQAAGTTAQFCVLGTDNDPLAPANSVEVVIQESQVFL